MNNNLSKEEIINKAFHFHSKGIILEAAKYYQYFINKGFKDYRVFSNYGVILESLEKLQEAELLYRKAIELKPDYIVAISNLGNILRLLGKFQEAELSTLKAIELKPDFANAHSNLGSILSDLGRLSEAEASYRKALEIDPNIAETHYNLGNILKNLYKLKDAELSYKKAIEINPTYAEAYSNLGNIFKELGKLKDAELSYKKAIEINPNCANAYLNMGSIFQDLGKLKEAKIYTQKAIEINPNCANAYLNMGCILKNLGRLKDAELSTLKAIELNPDLSKAYFVLSTIDVSISHHNWHNYLFTKDIFKKQNEIDKIDIYFARGNILERKLNYAQSANMFKKGNNLNRKVFGSDYIQIKNDINYYYKVNQKIKRNKDKQDNLLTNIFIVGLPRSGKTITESILACNKALLQCGEDNGLCIAVNKFLNKKENKKNQNLYQIYIESISKKISGESFICTTRPGNYIYTGLIASQIPNSKVVYCYRNPLDNIKEMYCSNLMNQYTFKTSIVESANILLSINELMEKYKKIFNSRIYFLNYDNLVLNKEIEIKSLLSWLGWKYETKYLHPKIDPTSDIKSDNKNIEINTKYQNTWKNYQKLLKPAIDIITSKEKYRHLISQ